MTKLNESLYAALKGTGVEIRENEPLSRHSTFRIGGPADLYAEPASRESFCKLLSAAKQTDVRTLVIGRGSNLLFDDQGYRGLVVSTVGMKSIETDSINCRITADAGASLASVAAEARVAALSGLEFAGGIPGSVGGAVFMNAGAYGGEISSVLLTSEYYDRSDGTVHTLPQSGHAFGYRESVYRKHPDWLILSAVFRLTHGDREEIGARMEELMQKRKEKQPLEYPSAGSAFKRYPGYFTAQLIDEAGLKGYSVGGAQVSEKHAGFIINRGGATSSDVRRLLDHVRDVIRQRNGITIEPEIVYIPAEDSLN